MQNDPLSEYERKRLSLITLKLRTAHIVLTACVLIAGCSPACHVTEFDGWSTADHIDIRLGNQRPQRTITDPSLIAKIATFAQAHADDWGSPWYGTPIGNITLEVYSGHRFMGHLAIGPTFLESQGCDDFMSRSLSQTDRRVILSLVGLPEDSST
jgi:hypothetical protein